MFTAKFKLVSVEDFGNNNVKANFTVDTNDHSFTQWTPMGSISFMCTNPDVNAQLKPGEIMTVTFSE